MKAKFCTGVSPEIETQKHQQTGGDAAITGIDLEARLADTFLVYSEEELSKDTKGGSTY